jgi:hypothetical protein
MRPAGRAHLRVLVYPQPSVPSQPKEIFHTRLEHPPSPKATAGTPGSSREVHKEFQQARRECRGIFVREYPSQKSRDGFLELYPEHCRKGLNALLLETVAFIFSTVASHRNPNRNPRAPAANATLSQLHSPPARGQGDLEHKSQHNPRPALSLPAVSLPAVKTCLR